MPKNRKGEKRKPLFEAVPGTRLEVCYHHLTPHAGKYGAYHARLMEPGYPPIYVTVGTLQEVRPALIKRTRTTGHPKAFIAGLQLTSVLPWRELLVPNDAARMHLLPKGLRTGRHLVQQPLAA